MKLIELLQDIGVCDKDNDAHAFDYAYVMADIMQKFGGFRNVFDGNRHFLFLVPDQKVDEVIEYLNSVYCDCEQYIYYAIYSPWDLDDIDDCFNKGLTMSGDYCVTAFEINHPDSIDTRKYHDYPTRNKYIKQGHSVPQTFC